MRWSKVRKLVADSFADSVKGRVSVHTTQYRTGGSKYSHGCECGHGWLQIDGVSVMHADTHMSYRLFGSGIHETTSPAWKGARPWPGHRPVDTSERVGDNLAEPGEFSRYDIAMASWQYLHTSLNASLASPNPMIRSFALLNAKVGRTRLARQAAAETHPLPRALAEFRIAAESELRERATAGTTVAL